MKSFYKSEHNSNQEQLARSRWRRRLPAPVLRAPLAPLSPVAGGEERFAGGGRRRRRGRRKGRVRSFVGSENRSNTEIRGLVASGGRFSAQIRRPNEPAHRATGYITRHRQRQVTLSRSASSIVILALGALQKKGKQLLAVEKKKKKKKLVEIQQQQQQLPSSHKAAARKLANCALARNLNASTGITCAIHRGQATTSPPPHLPLPHHHRSKPHINGRPFLLLALLALACASEAQVPHWRPPWPPPVSQLLHYATSQVLSPAAVVGVVTYETGEPVKRSAEPGLPFSGKERAAGRLLGPGLPTHRSTGLTSTTVPPAPHLPRHPAPLLPELRRRRPPRPQAEEGPRPLGPPGQEPETSQIGRARMGRQTFASAAAAARGAKSPSPWRPAALAASERLHRRSAGAETQEGCGQPQAQEQKAVEWARQRGRRRHCRQQLQRAPAAGAKVKLAGGGGKGAAADKRVAPNGATKRARHRRGLWLLLLLGSPADGLPAGSHLAAPAGGGPLHQHQEVNGGVLGARPLGLSDERPEADEWRGSRERTSTGRRSNEGTYNNASAASEQEIELAGQQVVADNDAGEQLAAEEANNETSYQEPPESVSDDLNLNGPAGAAPIHDSNGLNHSSGPGATMGQVNKGTITATPTTATSASLNGGQAGTASALCSEMDNVRSGIPSATVRLVFFTLYGTIFAIGLLGNTLTLYAMCRKREKSSIIDIFIANLALSDIMLCIFAVPITPIYMLYYGHWVFGPGLCKAFTFAQGSSVYISTFTMISIAQVRYQLIVHPLRESMSKLVAFLLNLCTWILGFLVTLPYLMHVGLLPENCAIKFCDEYWDEDLDRFWFSVITLILQFFLPFIAVSFFYGSIFWKLRRQKRRRQREQKQHHHLHHHQQAPVQHLHQVTPVNNSACSTNRLAADCEQEQEEEKRRQREQLNSIKSTEQVSATFVRSAPHLALEERTPDGADAEAAARLELHLNVQQRRASLQRRQRASQSELAGARTGDGPSARHSPSEIHLSMELATAAPSEPRSENCETFVSRAQSRGRIPGAGCCPNRLSGGQVTSSVSKKREPGATVRAAASACLMVSSVTMPQLGSPAAHLDEPAKSASATNQQQQRRRLNQLRQRVTNHQQRSSDTGSLGDTTVASQPGALYWSRASSCREINEPEVGASKAGLASIGPDAGAGAQDEMEGELAPSNGDRLALGANAIEETGRQVVVATSSACQHSGGAWRARPRSQVDDAAALEGLAREAEPQGLALRRTLSYLGACSGQSGATSSSTVAPISGATTGARSPEEEPTQQRREGRLQVAHSWLGRSAGSSKGGNERERGDEEERKEKEDERHLSHLAAAAAAAARGQEPHERTESSESCAAGKISAPICCNNTQAANSNEVKNNNNNNNNNYNHRHHNYHHHQHRHHRHHHHHHHATTNTTTSSGNSQQAHILALKEQRMREKDKRLSQTNRKLLFMVVLFVFSWLPLNMFNLVQDYFETFSDSPYIKHVFVIVHLIACSSVCYNPILYAWMSDNYRQELRDILPSGLAKKCRCLVGKG